MSDSRDSRARGEPSESSVQPTSLATQQQLADFAAHEFRGSLHTLQAFLSILLQEQSGPLNDIQRDFVSSMFFITRRLERLTDDVQILMSEGEGFSINLQEVNVLSIAEDCRRELAPLSEGLGVRLQIVGESEKDWRTLSDPVRITQIMINLLENAIRHANGDTSVVLRLRQSSSRMLMIIQNEAVHPPSGSIDHWFTPYFRESSANERAPHGLGLGLAIVSHLVAALGGRIVTRIREREVTIAVCLPHAAVANVQA